jgi:hypothetical protein
VYLPMLVLQPMFGRKSPEINMMHRNPAGVVRDDEIHINTQSGTQWDGLRHVAVLEHGMFYNKCVGTFFVDESR